MAEEGAVAVCVRVRPLSSREEELGETAQVYWKTDNNAIYQVDGSKSFNFDRVFHSNETTKNVYEEIAAPIIDSAIQGYNGTIFAYGQTASGKTYTMMGSEDHLGVIPRAIHDIFQKIKKFPDREFLLRVSYMEIYNETITDLFCGTQKMKPLIIREDVNRNVYVADLTEEVVYTSEMALKWITKGEKNRHYGKTKMNQRSSRSHTIFRMILESREKGEPSNCEGSVKVSHLNLVDLAGSERAAQTGAEGVRLKEGCNINRSLFILGQVIKKLSDGQIGGFINYRDSKLTRILQNSLGGNAKTRIICTVTPVSFDETLTTLQFASTAKYMKNTPYVNEVSSDEALLKRYRKEIMDLKKQLEEVSSETRARAMEKDQLAQLLEEKDLLQKVQNEKIENLTRMLVTSSSLTSQQELKAKRKRRVTWCLGKINKMKDSNYAGGFQMPTTITTKTHKPAITLLGEIDESLCSESDFCSNTLDTLSEIEWNPATKLLNQENVESELNSLRANYDNLVIDYEQLRTEKEEMELKLKEKNDLDEFEALERKTKKDQENELSSKADLLIEKEDQIKKLQQYIASQQLENMKMDLSYSSENTEDLKKMRQTLFDAETVALDANRVSAFLRSENLELKEKMKELATTCKQMENDTQLYQSQLEAKKKMQIDLEKELQSAFNEITKLTSFIDGKVPKDLLSNMELERKITDLQKELKKKVEENETLQKEVNLLSELKSLPPEVEMLRKEIHDKSEELCIITSEKDKLFSEVVHKESRIQGLLEEIGKTKDDLTTAQSNYKSTDQEFQDFKSFHMEFEQKYKMVLEENERMNQEIGNLSKEAQNFGISLDALKTELSHKTQELQQKTFEDHERLSEVEQLKKQLENRGSMLQTVEEEKTLITEKLQQTLGEVRILTQERDELKQLQESLQIERDQLKSDIQDTVNMNIDAQEQLRNALESLKLHQETINTLQLKISKETSRNLHTVENIGETKEFQQKIDGIDKKKNLDAKNTQTLIADVKDDEVIEQQRKIFSLIQEKNELQQMLESVTMEKEQLKTDLKENIEMTIENQEELRILGDELKKQQEIVAQEKSHTIKKEEELSRTCERLAEVEEKLKEKSQQLQEKQQELLSVQEEMSEKQEKVNEMENLKNELKNHELTMEHMEMERLKLAQKLHENYEEMKSITKERNDLKELQESFETERDQLKGYIREIEAAGLQTKEELKIAHMHLKEHQETIDELRRSISEKTAQIISIQQDLEKSKTELQEKIQELQEKEDQFLKMKAVKEAQEETHEMEHLKEQFEAQKLTLENTKMENVKLTQRLHENLEEMKSITKERDDLRSMEETLKVERDQLKEKLRETIILDLEKQEELKIAHRHVKGHQETIDKLRGIVSQKTDEISNMQIQLENSDAALKAQIQELQEKEHQLLKGKNDLEEAMYQTEQLKKQLEAQSSTLESIKMEKLRLTQKLHENLEEIGFVTKENNSLRRAEETLKMERDQLRESLRETEAKDLKKQEELRIAYVHLKEHQETIDKLRGIVSEKTDEISNMQIDLENSNAKLREKNHQNHEEVVTYEKRLLSDGQQHLTESLREKCFRIKELLKRYSEMNNHYECLNGLSLDLETEIETQKELSIRVKANLSLPDSQIKQIQKLLTANQRCSMEFHRIVKKFKYVLSYITKMKEEQHESINKLEMDFIGEVEKQNKLLIKIQHLQDCDVPCKEFRDLKLNQNMDLHIEEILKDFSESDFPSLKTKFQQVLSNRKEMTQFLEEWLNTHFDIEKFKNCIQKENDRICQVNYFFNNKIIAIMNESTEFEERSAIISKDWEHDLKSLKDQNEKLFKNYQTLKITQASGAHVNNPNTQDSKNPHVTSSAIQLTTEKIQELETSLRVAKENAMHKEDKIIKMEKELKVTNDIIAKLQAEVNESNRCLEKTKETIQVLQDKVALGSKPYKEEIEDLKTKLVKTDLEKMKNAKEFEKEITSTKATIEHQKEVIRLLRENLRRIQQAQDTSMVSEHIDSQPSNKPLTCGGGSGIVQNTKALILKSEYVRLQKEISKLKQQNEQLTKQKNELLSNNHRLSNEVKTWKERTFKREAHKEVFCENFPKSPKVTGTASEKRQVTPSQCKEWNLQDPVPKESPKSWFFDSRSKSLPAPHPIRYFDNSSLGLCPEVQSSGTDSVDPQPGPRHAPPEKDAPECRTQ
ncbi:centromere-associated protein E isoform X2 [Lemur catta]|uniref:centromere-associated protein E isoform X2 n=1 Tax=Lemur catta TaxID=9447 RepID=UPI001E26C012|nr:centromere-associated protein E isoform X2 [Lemur catta]